MSDEKENGESAIARDFRLRREQAEGIARLHRENDVEAFVEKVLLSKPVAAITRRAIMIQTGYYLIELERIDQQKAVALKEHQQKLAEIAQDAAVTEGIDLSLYQLACPGDVPPYWRPR